MKRLIFLFSLLAATPLAGFAQNHETVVVEQHAIRIVDSLDRPTVVIRGRSDERATISVAGFDIELGAKRSEADRKKRSMRPSIDMLNSLQLGFNMLTAPDYSGYTADEGDFLELNNGKSIHFSFNLIGLHVPLVRFENRSKLSFLASLGLKWSNYTFSNDITLEKIGGRLHPRDIDGRYKKSKLTTFALSVPVELKYESRSKFKASVGGYVDFTTRQFTKYKKPKHKNVGDYGVNFMQFGVIAKVGYRQFYLFGSYGLTPLFKDWKGPRTNPFTVGFGFGI